MTALQTIWLWLTRRSLVGSDAVIVWAILVHAYEAYVFAADPSAFGSIPMAALLRFCGGLRWTACAALTAAIVMAALGMWAPRLTSYERFLLLAPQLIFFFVTSVAAISAALHGSYADYVPRSFNFIGTDQIDRIGLPFLYILVAIARAKPRVLLASG